MLSSVLNSEIASQVNIQIVRIFTRLRDTILSNKEMLMELEELRNRMDGQDDKIEAFYNYLTQFEHQQNEERVKIGFK